MPVTAKAYRRLFQAQSHLLRAPTTASYMQTKSLHSKMGAADKKARVLLIGSGGVGTMASYALETGGMAEVTAVCRSNYEVAVKDGFSIDSIEHGQGITGFKPSHILDKIPRVAEQNQEPYDYLLVTTKNVPDVRPNVLDLIEPAVTSEQTTIVLLQNGLNIELPIIKRFPTNIVLSGISLIGATETSHARVRHDDADRVKLGPFPNQAGVSPARAEAVARHFIDMYMACGVVNWEYDDDVKFTRWRKLVYNSCFNSVAAILGMDTARMRMSQIVIDDLVKPSMREIMAIAKSQGVDLPHDIDETIIRMDPTDTAFVPSMGQDALKVSRSEIGAPSESEMLC